MERAKLEFRDGTPFSAAYGDIYHSAAGGPEQSRHVFLAGNGLPERWRGAERFVVFETGFGFGLNFLVTWQAWRRDPQRCARLHFVSVEKYPFSLEDLRLAHARYPELAREAQALHASWPMLVPGAHRLEFDDGKVVLTLFFADVKVVRELRLAADAIYLDGFAPAKNPDMWSHALMRSISRLAAPGATAATWSVAAQVRDALERTGFSVEKRKGFASKSEMLVASYQGRASARTTPASRSVSVIGAGLAGAAVCERLCARGWEATLYERNAEPAQEASGNLAGTFHPLMTPDDSVFARLTRAGFLYSLADWSKLANVRWDRCGVLQLARNEKEEASQRAAIAALAPPSEYAQYVTRDEASQHAGVPVGASGLWFPEGGWIQPRELVRAQLEACGQRLERIFGKQLEALPPERPIVLATAADELQRVPHARMRRVRGQVTHIPAERIDAPRVVVLRGGFVLPPVEGLCVVGASYDLEDEDAAVRADSHGGNIERLERILPALNPQELAPLQGRVAFRAVVPDRLPIVGEIAPGVYCAIAFGSRGLVWAALAGELIGSMLEGEPMPIEGRLVDALSPARFRRASESRGSRP
jgi:tRNA 5-methylaminomethyl-2-thiouridine biosynthesis bifunctional protein